MRQNVAIAGLLIINALLAVGDLLAKKAVAAETRSAPLTTAALAMWIVACCMWLPVMRARGFTKLVALADVIGLVIVAAVGYAFLHERLTPRELAGVGFAIVSIFLLGGA